MRTEIVNVTPKLASKWLAMNINNRPLRRTVVDGLKAAFLRGEYIQTHQGIAFSTTGELLDGQHRLTAISELGSGEFRMVVAWDVHQDSFQVIDIGAKRTPADALRIEDRRLVEAARLVGAICLNKKTNVTPMMLLPIIDAIQDPHDAIVSFCPTQAKCWSSSPVRLGAVICMMTGGNHDYIKATYRALVLADFDAMSPVARALFSSHIRGVVRASNSYDMLARCMIVFHDKKANLTRIQINDTSEAIAKVKATFSSLIPDVSEPEKKKASPKGLAKSVLQSNSSLYR